ncbi:hypothetical protein DFQ27_008157 [Actinomortierella ambigua]|uniref:Cytochrome P450 n=1 Tax=Actinomortierella ambigua TaxID=1343610 RepID=A0A9P6PRY5_9FUNG|nr:hypothetical protein DFQ27_008157 [Actinomortierella ambigua]
MIIITQLVSALAPLLAKDNRLKVGLAVAALVVHRFWGRAPGTRRRKDLKGPWEWPILGGLITMATVPPSDMLNFLTRMDDTYGPVWTVSIPGVGRLITIDSPELVEYCLKTNFWNYEKGEDMRVRCEVLFGHGIFTADGDNWRFQRKLASHIFTVRAFREYTNDVFVLEAMKVVNLLGQAADEGLEIDFQELMHKFTLDAFGVVSFGKSFGCLDSLDHEPEFAVAIDKMMALLTERMFDPLWKVTERFTERGQQFQRLQKLVQQYSIDVIRERRECGIQEGSYKPFNVLGDRKDLLQMIMETTDGEGNPLSDDMIKDMVLNYTLAARDTTAQALTWLFFNLLKADADSEVLNRLVDEIDSVFQGNTPTYETHKRQKWGEACLFETLRLYPVVPRNMKRCISDDILPDGTRVYEGEFVSWSTWAMGRQESIWGPDARQFRPERWLNSEKPSQGKFSSFHVGPRVCLGQQFAIIESMVLLALVFQRFTFEMVDPNRGDDYELSFTLPMAKGLLVRVKRRQDVSTH